MFCQNCGSKITENARACPYCGAELARKKGPSKIVVVLRAVGIWVVSAFVVAFVGAVISGGKASGILYSAAILCLPIFLAVKFAVPKKYRAKSASAGRHLAEPDRPVSAAPIAPAQSLDYTEKTYRVAGISYREENVMKLAKENEMYSASKKEIITAGLTDQPIWKYKFQPCKIELIPEPENPADPNAIKVVVDNQHIGYIKAGSCAHMHNLIRDNRIRGITCKIGGGPYKELTEDFDGEKENYITQTGTDNFTAVLTVREST